MMDTRRKVTGPSNDIILTPKRRTTRSSVVEQDGKQDTPKKCHKECTEKISLLRGMHSLGGSKDTCTPSQCTRSKVKLDTDSPHNSMAKQSKRCTEAQKKAQTGAHIDTPSRKTKRSSSLDEELVESPRKKSKYILNLDADSTSDLPLKSTNGSLNKDGDTDGTPSRQTRGRPKLHGKAHVSSAKENKINSSMVEVGKQNLNVKSNTGTHCRKSKSNIKCEEKSKSDSQRHGRVNTNVKEVSDSECPSRHTRSSSRSLKKSGESRRKYKVSERKRKLNSADSIVGELSVDETLVSPIRHTRRCIIFSDSNESDMKEINKLPSSSPTSHTTTESIDLSNHPGSNVDNESSTVSTRQSKHFLSKTVLHNSDDESKSSSSSSVTLENLPKHSLSKKTSSVVKDAPTNRNQKCVPSGNNCNKEAVNLTKSESLQTQRENPCSLSPACCHGASKCPRHSSPTQNKLTIRYSPDEQTAMDTTDSVQVDQAAIDGRSPETSSNKPLQMSSPQMSSPEKCVDGSNGDSPNTSEALLQDKDATASKLGDESFKTGRRAICLSLIEDHMLKTSTNLHHDEQTHFEMQTTAPIHCRRTSQITECNKAGNGGKIDTKTAESNIESLEKLETRNSSDESNLSNIQDVIITPKYSPTNKQTPDSSMITQKDLLTNEQLQMGSSMNIEYQLSCEDSISSKLNLNTNVSTESLSLNDVQDASKDLICKESKDSLATDSVETDTSETYIWYTEADDKGKDEQDSSRSVTPMPSTSSSEILLCPQDSVSSVWTRELLDELVDISSSASDASVLSGDMGYNLEDFVLRRRRLRSESQDNELWEGLPASVRYRKSASKARQLKSKDMGNDTDSVDDVMLCPDSNCMLSNSDTDCLMSDTLPQCHDNTAHTEHGSEENNSLLAKIEKALRCSSDIHTKSGEAEIDKWLTLSSETNRAGRNSIQTNDDPKVLNAPSCSGWTSSSTLVANSIKETHETSESYTIAQSGTCENKNDIKVLLDTSSSVEDETKNSMYTSILQTPARIDVMKRNVCSIMASKCKDTCSVYTNSNPCSLLGDRASPLTNDTCTMSSNEKYTKVISISDTDIQITLKDDTQITENKSPTQMNDTAFSQSSDLGSVSSDGVSPSYAKPSSTSLLKQNTQQSDVPRTTVNDKTPTSQREIFLAPLNKCDGVRLQTRRSLIQSKEHTSTNRPEAQSLLINAMQMRTLKSTPRPTTTSSTPWMYNKRKLKTGCLGSPFLSCSSTKKSSERNDTCSSSGVNESLLSQCDQTCITLNMITPGQRAQQHIIDGDMTDISSTQNNKQLKTKTNAGVRAGTTDKSSRATAKKTDDVVKADVSKEIKGSSSVLNEAVVIDAKLNYQKSKFPKVVLTPLKRSQRLIKKYGIDCQAKDVKTKQKKKKQDTVTSNQIKDETLASSKNQKEVSSDTVLPSVENVVDVNRCANGSERKLAVRKHRRKQDLEYKLTDDDEARLLPRVRKKSNLGSNTSAQEQKAKVTERKNKKGINKPNANSAVPSSSNNMFGLRRKRGPVVDEELLANSLYNKHACVLWSSEHRRHYHLIHPNADFNQLDNILRKHWDELLPTEKMRYFNRARDAVLDEFKHSKKSNTVSKQKSRSKESNQNISPMEKFCQLNAKRQKELLSKWLFFYQKVLTCRDYKWFIGDVQRTLKNIQSSQKNEYKPLTSSKLEHRKLLFDKINKIKPKVIALYMDRCKKTPTTAEQSEKSVIRNLIRGLPQNFPKGFRSRYLSCVLEDLRELESKSLIHVVGIPKSTPSYTKVHRSILDSNRVCVHVASSTGVCHHGVCVNDNRKCHVHEAIVVDAAAEMSRIEKPLLDCSNNEYVNKLISDLHTLKELPVLEASEIESAFINLQTQRSDQSRSAAASQSKTIGRSLVTALHKQAVEALARSQSGSGETCCELDSPSCILSTWLVADRVAIGTEPVMKK